MIRLEEPSPEIVAVVTDIEGTTSDIAFQRDVLRPYARRQLPDFVRAHADDPGVHALLEEVRRIAGEGDADDERVIALLAAWMDAGRTAAPLAALREMVWRQGYERHDITGHVYGDAVAALQAWADDRRALFVYAAVPVAAQKLLFGYSDHGDLSGLFSGYFDTRIGARKKRASFAAIAAELGEAPAHLLFVSNTGGALDAAAAAGWQTCWVARDEDTQEKARISEAHPVVASFDEIEIV